MRYFIKMNGLLLEKSKKKSYTVVFKLIKLVVFSQ